MAKAPQRVTIRDANGDGVTLTATVKDVPTYEVDITQHAVESGANVLDHARPKLIKLAMEGVVSDLSDGEGAAEDAMYFFIGLRDSPRPVEIIGPYIGYSSMLMAKLEMPRKKEDGGARRFVLEFLEYKVANIKRTTVEVRLDKRAKKGTQPKSVRMPEPNRGGFLKQASDQVRQHGGVLPALQANLPGLSSVWGRK